MRHHRSFSYTDIFVHSDADGLVRCVPGEDHTNGFFVSCFVRNGVLSVNEGSSQQKARHETVESSSSIHRAEKRRATDEPGKPLSLDPENHDNDDRALGDGQHEGGSTNRRKKKRKKKVS